VWLPVRFCRAAVSAAFTELHLELSSLNFTFLRMLLRAAVLWIALLAIAPALHAQIRVEMKLPRRLYIAYEPVVATVSVTNLTGRDVLLDDFEGQKWFSFQISTGEDRLVPPRDMDYQLTPLMLPAGQTVKRTVNLTSLYPITDFGLYRLRASIYFPELRKYFSSAQSTIEISEGKLIWQQTVGVPEGLQGAGTYRLISLLTFRRPKDNMLYVRVEDKEGGVVYVTAPLGRVLTSNEPQVQLDQKNQLHVLQVVGPKTYLYSRVGLNGESLGTSTYHELQTRPRMRKLASGTVEIAGGQVDAPVATAAAGPPPKLSDRPASIPLQ
jgi:hypothetical protein